MGIRLGANGIGDLGYLTTWELWYLNTLEFRNMDTWALGAWINLVLGNLWL